MRERVFTRELDHEKHMIVLRSSGDFGQGAGMEPRTKVVECAGLYERSKPCWRWHAMTTQSRAAKQAALVLWNSLARKLTESF